MHDSAIEMAKQHYVVEMQHTGIIIENLEKIVQIENVELKALKHLFLRTIEFKGFLVH